MVEIITQEILKQLLNYNFDNGEFNWRVSRGCSPAWKNLHSVDRFAPATMKYVAAGMV